MEYWCDKIQSERADEVVVDKTHQIIRWTEQFPMTPSAAAANGGSELRRALPKLTALCANCIANHSKDISLPLLKSTPWSAGRFVWEQICQNGHDSYDLFLIFAEVYAHYADFRCHHQVALDDNQNKREKFLQKHLLPSPHHRIEWVSVGGNVNANSASLILPLVNVDRRLNGMTITDFGTRLRHVTLLDLSGLNLNRDTLTGLMQLTNLVGLDVSNTGVLDLEILPIWKAAMTSGRWKNLQVLCLGSTREDNHVTQRNDISYLTLFKIPSLLYIEGPKIDKTECPIEWKHGKYVPGIGSNFTRRYTLTWKLRFVQVAIEKKQEGRDQATPVRDTTKNTCYHEVFVGSSDSRSWQTKEMNTMNCYFRIQREKPPSKTKKINNAESERVSKPEPQIRRRIRSNKTEHVAQMIDRLRGRK